MYDSIVTRPATWADLPACLEVEHAAMKANHYLADVADRFIRKGSQVYIEGSLRTRDWTDKDGNKRYATEIVANDLKMLGRRGDAPASGADNSYGGSYGGAAQSSQSSPSPSGDIAASAPQEVDDLPF